MTSNKKQHIAYLVIFLFFLSLNVTGCAATGKSKSVYKKLSKSSIRIDHKRYIPLSAVCSNYKLTWEWDGFTRIITVKKFNMETKMYPGSSLILHENQVQRLEGPVRIYKGMVMVPESFSRLFFKKEKVYLPPKKRENVFRVRKIVVDPGHGGKDPGAGRKEIQEKRVNLDIAKRLKKQLTKHGLEVILTRDSDIFHSLSKRTQIANKAQADLFISVHTNASKSPSAYGFEAYYLSPDFDDFAKAVQLRENAAVKFEKNTKYKYSDDLNATLWDMLLSENRVESMEMAGIISSELKRLLKLKTRYVRGANFYVLKGAQMPAVLLEVGYLSNKTEAARLNNSHYRQMLAEAIASGILRYKKEFELNNGFTR